jgi:hypothetical protein
MSARSVDVSGERTRDRVLGALEKAALAAAEGAWVDAAGYDQRALGAT